MLWSYVGDDPKTEGKQLYNSFRPVGTTFIRTLKETAYAVDSKSLQMASLPYVMNGNWYENALMVTEMTDEVLEILLKYTAKPIAPNSDSQIVVFQLGGAISRVPIDATAFPYRKIPFWIMVLGRWKTPSNESPEEYAIERAKVQKWVRSFSEELKPYTTKETYNTLGKDQTLQLTTESTSASPTNESRINRLRSLKSKYDPENVLRRNKNILPWK